MTDWYRPYGTYNRKGRWIGTADLITTGSTQTDIITFTIHPGETATVECDVMVQTDDGDTYRAVYHLKTGFYRAHDGNITQIDDLVDVGSFESSTSLDVDIVADTSNQTIDVRVTGIASTTLYWSAECRILLNRGAK